MRLLEGLSETLRFSIFSSLFLLSLYFLSYNFLYHKVYSLFLSLHPKNKTLAHLPLSVGNHPRVVLHHYEQETKLQVHTIGLVEKAREKGNNHQQRRIIFARRLNILSILLFIRICTLGIGS